MWIIGALIGMVLFAIFDGAHWLLGALVGAFGGATFAHNSRLRERLAEIELRLNAIDMRREWHPAPIAAREPARPTTVESTPAGSPTEAPALPIAEPPRRRVEPEPEAMPRRDGDLLISAWNRAMGGNPVVRIGVAILFLGVAMLLKYAHDRLNFPIELRLSAVAAGAIAMLVTGFRLRDRRAEYGLVLQGGGVAMLYITVYGAMRIWQLLPPTVAFAMMALIAILSGMLAVMQNSRTLAFIGTAGGFLAPVLVSTGAGNHVVLFGYYAILNLGIFAIARYRAWRSLNLLGFVFTFVIGTFWGVTRYVPEHYWSTQPFVIFFALLFTAIAVMFARAQASNTDRYLDGALVFGVPVIGFALQAGLVHRFDNGTAVSALVAGAAYLSLASFLLRHERARLPMLVEAFFAIGVTFSTLAIPLALDGRWTAASWALEGAALAWVGVRQKHLLARLAGYLLQILAAVALVVDVRAADGARPFADALFIGMLLLAIAGALSAHWLRKQRDVLAKSERATSEYFALWSIGWFGLAIAHDIIEHVADRFVPHALLVAGIALAASLAAIDRRIDWSFIGRIGLVSVLVLAAALAIDLVIVRDYPSGHFGWFAWPLAFAGHYWILRAGEHRAPSIAPLLHAATLWTVVTLLTAEFGGRVNDLVSNTSVWGLLAWAVVPATLLALLPRITASARWPLGAHRDAYLYVGGLPIAIVVGAGAFIAMLFSRGDTTPLPYVPIVNPLELASLAVGIAILRWRRALEAAGLASTRFAEHTHYRDIVGVIGFIAINAILIRTLHHWGGIPFRLDSMLTSKIAQAAFSILWTSIALGATVVATRIKSRSLWMFGATLLAIVVAKLFIIDLAGGVERVVSFIVVGLLMLAIGYLAPLPPKAKS